MCQPTIDIEFRCLYFVEETTLLHQIHAAYIVIFCGDDNQERYEVVPDGSYEISYVDLFNGEAT